MVRLQVAFRFSAAPGLLSLPMSEALINAALRSLYGQVGASQLLYTVLQWNEEAYEAAIEIEDSKDAVKVWTGLTLLSWFDAKRVRAKVWASQEDMRLIFPENPRKRR